MNGFAQCPECGLALASDAPEGNCPACLMRLAGLAEFGSGTQGTAADQPGAEHHATLQDAPLSRYRSDPAPGRTLGDYDLLEEIGRGGMGIVYKARQRSLDRVVALKLLLSGGLSSEAAVQRFKAEAQAAAGLEHPSIVSVYEIGCDSGCHYISMEYIKGQTLAQLAGNKPFPARKAAACVKTTAEAIHSAHEKGILHRDLKPSNVMLDSREGVRVMDFGLAKRLPEISASSTRGPELELTLTGQVLGSPNYLSPEQALARKDPSPATDVHALGAILYYLLTGRPPFLAETLSETLQQVIHSEPVSPRMLNARVPVDLETICLKCLQKSPGQRLASAKEVADELDRFLQHQPILSRPISRPEKYWRWCRKNPVVATLTAATALLMALIAAGSTLATIRISASAKALRDNLYIAQMNLAERHWENNDFGRLRETLRATARHPNRGFEWNYWQRLSHLEEKHWKVHSSGLLGMTLARDGQRLLTLSASRAVTLWDAAEGREIHSIRDWQWAVLSPDGLNVLVWNWGPRARLLDLSDERELALFNGHQSLITMAAFSSDGLRIATGSLDHTAKLWDAKTGRELYTFSGHALLVSCVAISADGALVLTGSDDKSARLWDGHSGQELLVLNGHTADVTAVALSPSSDVIATADDHGLAMLWNRATGQLQKQWSAHAGHISTLVFSPNGEWLLTGSSDASARVWSVRTGAEIRALKGHEGAVVAAAFPDGDRKVATASRDGSVRFWNLDRAAGFNSLPASRTAQRGICISPDGTRIVTSSDGGELALWNADSGERLFVFSENQFTMGAIAFSPDGKRLAAGGGVAEGQSFRPGSHRMQLIKPGADEPSGIVTVWDTETGRLIQSLPAARRHVRVVAFSPDGARLLTASGDDWVRIWDCATGRATIGFGGYPHEVRTAVFSPDGKRVATGGHDSTLRVWDSSTGAMLSSAIAFDHPVLALAFSPDGRTLAVGLESSGVELWNLEAARKMQTLKSGAMDTLAVVFTPEGQRLITASQNRLVKVWDVNSGEEILNLGVQGAETFQLALSTDGERIALSDLHQQVRVITVASPAEIFLWQATEQSQQSALNARMQAEQDQDLQRRLDRQRDPGLIKRWLILAPVPLPKGVDFKTALDLEQLPLEADLRPRAGDSINIEGTQLTWQEQLFEDGILDINKVIGVPETGTVAYAVSYVVADAEKNGVQIRYGSDDSAKIRLNGRNVGKAAVIRGLTIDDDIIDDLTLIPGTNVVQFKLANGGDTWVATLRFCDKDGKPVSGLREQRAR